MSDSWPSEFRQLIMARIDDIGAQLARLDEKINKAISSLSALEAEVKEIKLQRQRAGNQRWQLATAMVVALIALAATIVSALIR